MRIRQAVKNGVKLVVFGHTNETLSDIADVFYGKDTVSENFEIFKDLSKWILQLGSNKIENKIDGYNLRSFLIKHDNWYISIASDINSIKENPIICRYN